MSDFEGVPVFIKDNVNGFWWFNHKTKFPETLFGIEQGSANAIGYKYNDGHIVKTEYEVVLSKMTEFGSQKPGRFQLIKAGKTKSVEIDITKK